jgi:hypothetical protein
MNSDKNKIQRAEFWEQFATENKKTICNDNT